jgi:hypothetical protein
MKTLETQFKRCGYIQNLVKRNRHVAMYTVELSNGKVIGYEVFIIREQKEFVKIIAGNEVKFENKELKPRNEDFGETAFAPSILERAEEHFKTLTRRAKNRKKVMA